MSKQANVNPNNFIYEPGTNVEVEGQLLTALMQYISMVIDDNSELYFGDKFKFINPETGKTISKPKPVDVEAGKAVKIVDVEATVNSEPKFYRNQTAISGIRLMDALQRFHMMAIEAGKAVDYTTMTVPEDKQVQEEPKPELIID